MTEIGIGLLGGGYMGKAHAVAMLAVGAVFNTEKQQVNLGSIVVVESVEGPSVVFATAEFDSALKAKQILLADSKDGKSLAAPEGPFRIIVPDEKEPTRWVKEVWAIYIAQIVGPSKRP